MLGFVSQPNQLTRAEYERLQIGMQLVQVEAILGRGIETQRSITHRIFVWKNKDSPNKKTYIVL